jgi:hypothetical protein
VIIGGESRGIWMRQLLYAEESDGEVITVFFSVLLFREDGEREG